MVISQQKGGMMSREEKRIKFIRAFSRLDRKQLSHIYFKKRQHRVKPGMNRGAIVQSLVGSFTLREKGFQYYRDGGI